MKTIPTESARQRRRLSTGIKRSLFTLQGRLSVMNHRVGGRLSLRAIDLESLGAVFRDGPMSPSMIARRTGVHPATMTGILDRLQRADWITRERDASATDRRGVVIRVVTHRTPELSVLLAGMGQRTDRICDDYTEDELRLVADFLDRVAGAAQDAADDLAASPATGGLAGS